MTRQSLARQIASSEGRDFESLPRDLLEFEAGKFDRHTPFQVDYLAVAAARLAGGTA